MSRAMRLGLVVSAAAVLVAGFLVLRPDDDDETGAPTAAGQAETGPSQGPTESTQNRPTRPRLPVLRPGTVETIEVQRGQRVRFVVTSPTADEAHVHGYDLLKRVPAGGRARFDFPAEFEGEFEIELEQSEERIGALVVVP